jgi:hypothetical protein
VILLVTSHPLAIAASVTTVLIGTVMFLVRRLVAAESAPVRRAGSPR